MHYEIGSLFMWFFSALACLCGIENPGFIQFAFECGIVKFAW